MEHSCGSQEHEGEWEWRLETVWILGQFKTNPRKSAFYPGCDIVMQFAHLVLSAGGTVSGGAEMDSVFPRLFSPTVIFMDICPWLY